MKELMCVSMMLQKLRTLLLLGFCCVISVSGHSWIVCSDYMEENGEYYSSSLCRAYPRHGHQYTPKNGQFGQDTGYNVINPPSNAPCRTQRDDDSAYTADHPMAVYYPGQRVVLAHPTKNHVADVRCTNKYIPDNGNRIWLGPRDALSDVTLQEFLSNEIADLGVAPTGHQIPDAVTTQYPKPGFQNAPKFCENTDKSLATNVFTVPENLQSGRYTMMWGWYFNSLNDLYTSCWEVDIVGSRSERDQVLRSRSQSTADPVNIAGGSPTPAPAHTPTPSADSTTPPSGSGYYTMTGVPGPTPGQCICQCTGSNGVSSAGYVTVSKIIASISLLFCSLMSLRL